MSTNPSASRLRQQLRTHIEELLQITDELLQHRRMLPASLIERHLGTARCKRARSAFYLSYAIGGRTRLLYVPRAQVARIGAEVQAWKDYRRLMRRWRTVSQAVLQGLCELAEAQCRDLQEFHP